MPTILPPVDDVGMVRPGQSAAERAVARIAQPMKVGKTLIKRNGQWYCKRTPSQTELEEATHYFLGGHQYLITDALWDEIFTALNGTPCMPFDISPGLFPSLLTFPGDVIFMGDPTA